MAFACRLHSGADSFRILHLAFIGQLFIIDARDFDVDVDAVQQGATDLLLVGEMASAVQLHALTGSLLKLPGQQEKTEDMTNWHSHNRKV